MARKKTSSAKTKKSTAKKTTSNKAGSGKRPAPKTKPSTRKKPASKKNETKKFVSQKKLAARKKETKKTGSRKKPTGKPESPEKILKRLAKENDKLKEEIKAMKDKARTQSKEIASLQGKMETRVKREEVVMTALKIHSRTQKGGAGVVGDLNSSILKAEKYMLHMGKRIDNVLAAIKNHREYLIKLNRKVHTHDARKRIEMEVEIMNNSLSIMAMSGFDINKSLFSDVKKMRKMMEKKDVELSKLKKRLESLEKKFEDEMEKFDYESIFKKSDDIPGYR